MFFISIRGIKKRNRIKILLIASALVLAVMAAFILARCSAADSRGTTVSFDLNDVGSAEAFLAQFGLIYEKQESLREIILPYKDDALFSQYLHLQDEIGADPSRYSGKKVEERYLKLKNKARKDKSMYAVLLIYKGKVIGGHLTTLEKDVKDMPLNGLE